ncbi:aldehyde dehydrogenase family protein [Halobellus rubicundus]|uniref:L-glutamate gamma-semialdehyde dehydrogenase n=1 Tax=Halobellus rubicundus TaxID=2996466 RepID=A0ABD5MD07_9EURY
MRSQPFENEQTAFTHRREGTLDEFHDRYESAVERVRDDLGESHPLVIDGAAVERDERFSVESPGETDLLVGEFASGDEGDVDRAVAAATDAFDEWRHTHWRDRAAIFREAAERARDRRYELAAVLTLEAGKNRFEAVADVDEGIDFLRFYARELERNEGYRLDTGEPTPGQRCRNVLEPYGVFGVVGPFNFPFAIFVGMTTGALITGNTVVAKPASATPLIAHEAVSILSDAGVPDGALNLVTGGGRTVGEPLVGHEDVSGVAFTGSRAVGREIERSFVEREKPGPVIAELGGKNPVTVTAEADLEKAVEGVRYGAFGFGGQKCSATSRVYVHEDVADAFTERLVETTEEIPDRAPDDPGAVVAPLVDDDAVERYREVCETAREVGRVLTGGEVVGAVDGAAGRYVRPTVAVDVPHDHDVAREEHFVPFVTIHPVGGLDEGIRKSNDSEYGLCAGLFSEDDAEIETWLDRIESGMCYVNRSQSATTGALVQAQPFGGWKASGTTSKFAGGYWYLPQFMREQTRTVVGDAGPW